MCCPYNAKFPSIKIDLSVRKIELDNARILAVSLKEGDLYCYVSNLIDRHIDFDQWEFCVI